MLVHTRIGFHKISPISTLLKKSEHAGSLQLNFLQRIYHDLRNNQRQSTLPSLLGELLVQINRPALEDMCNN